MRNEENLRAALREAARAHIRSRTVDDCFGVTLTLKQRSGVHLDDIRAATSLRHLMNRLNTAVYGKRFSRFGTRLAVFPVLEKSSTGRLHYHLILQNPFPETPSRFEALIAEQWAKTEFGYNEIHCDYHIDHGWSDYITKFSTQQDQVDCANCHWS